MKFPRPVVCLRVIFPLLLSSSLGAADSALIARRTLTISGTVEGTLQVLDNSTIVIDRDASIAGDIVVPAEKTRQPAEVAIPDLSLAEKLKPSSRTIVDNRGGKAALQGEVRAIETFDLPKVLQPSRPVKSNSRVLQGTKDSVADFATVGSLTLKLPKTTLSVPAGSYADFVIAQGAIQLGVAGSAEPTRYEFRSLDVQSGSRIEVVGPVVVTVARGGNWRGKIGNAEAPLWLDIRVAQDDLILGAGADFQGFLSAPASKVTVSNGAKLTGGVACDQLVVAAGGKVTETKPNWSAAATTTDRPRFMHKALRLQGALPALKVVGKQTYFPAISYVEDVPHMMVAESRRSREGGRMQQHQLFFETCRVFFSESSFEQGVITLVEPPSTAEGSPTTRNIVLTREQFETMVVAIGAKGQREENLRSIGMSPRLQAEFMTRCVRLGAKPYLRVSN